MDVVTSRLLLPLLQELGRRWEQDEGSIAEEHFFAFYLRNKLGARFHHRPKTSNGAKLLMACLPGDRHEAGLLLFALGASSAGYVTILLGADMPFEDLPAVVVKTGCQAIVLSGVLMPAPELLGQDLPRLTRRTNVPVLLGGPASVKAHDVLRRTGVRPLGADLTMGLERLLEIVPVNQR
jgi:MerR family transcriptional regulator, light-induced transcriptional regulator